MGRTFGFELEFADARKDEIYFPDGYTYAKHDGGRFHNSTGKKVNHNGNCGGEINTRPLEYNDEGLDELNKVIQSIKSAGGYIMWNFGFDAHLYAGDCDIEVIKRAFELSYWVAPFIKKIFKLPEWFENKYISPSPTYDYVKKINSITKIEDIANVFANASNRGHVRFYVNIMPLIKIGTIEFRFFNGSWNFDETKETIKFMYSFLDYATNNDPAGYRDLNSVDACLKAFDINEDKIPGYNSPLLWASSHDNFKTLIEEAYPKSNSVLKKIQQLSENYHTAISVNSYYGDIEQILKTDRIRVIVNNLFMYSFWDVIITNKIIPIGGDYKWMETEKGDKAERLAKLMLYKNVRIANKSDVYHMMVYEDYKKRYDEYVVKYKEKATQLLLNLSEKQLTVQYGDINTAIKGSENELIVYQTGFSAKLRAASNGLARDTGMDPVTILTDYKKVNLSNKNYIVVSKNKFLDLEMNFRSNRDYVYSNSNVIKRSVFSDKVLEPLEYKIIPKDHEITRKSRIQFLKAKRTQVDYLRVRYIKYGIQLGSAPFCYIWFVDGYVIGATMFDFAKATSSGSEKIYMKSDFVVDSEVWRLSKFLIMCTLLDTFKEELDIRFQTSIDKIQTTVFTDKPVSMKYRSVYKMTKREGGKLNYEAHAGSLTKDQLMDKYLKSKK